ncbi:MAG: DUF2007 domain-containing protein [Lachnospiraceae bacterium]|nr:DUF2007 domain-containing protein [Lachnospiraceae bacterium]
MKEELIKIFTAQDNIQAEMILATLSDNNIPALKKDIGSAGIMNLYGGNSNFGEEIYVAVWNAEKAEEVLRDMGLC